MLPPTIILIGFSTAGKSHYLREIEKLYPKEFNYLDSDKYISNDYDGHIYNVFMQLGRIDALKYIETKEIDFLNYAKDNTDKPQLIAAGPFLVIRNGWKEFVAKRKPFIVHINKGVEAIYEGLHERRAHQISTLDNSNSNIGCWDDNVTTKLINGIYEDISKSEAIENISGHFNRITPTYKSYSNCSYDSETLRNNPKNIKT